MTSGLLENDWSALKTFFAQKYFGQSAAAASKATPSTPASKSIPGVGTSAPPATTPAASVPAKVRTPSAVPGQENIGVTAGSAALKENEDVDKVADKRKKVTAKAAKAPVVEPVAATDSAAVPKSKRR